MDLTINFPAFGLLLTVARFVAWCVFRAFGAFAYRIGWTAAHYFALRAMCNWCRRDSYGRPTGKVFRCVISRRD